MGGDREFSPEGYGNSVVAGGARRDGEQPKQGLGAATRRIRQQGVVGAAGQGRPSVLLEGPKVPNVESTQPPQFSGAQQFSRGEDGFYRGQPGTKYADGLKYSEDAVGQIGRSEGWQMNTPQFAQPNSVQMGGAPTATQPYAPPAVRNGMWGADGLAEKYTGAMSGAVEAYGRQAGIGMNKQVGELLGNLNSIGALRSGGVVAGTRNIAQGYASTIGDYASMTAKDALSMAQGEDQFGQDLDFRGRELNEGARRFDADLGFRASSQASDNAFRYADLSERGRQANQSDATSRYGINTQAVGDATRLNYEDSWRTKDRDWDREQYGKEYDWRKMEYEAAKKASKRRGIGSILGGIAGGAIGFFGGGPAGAMAGASAGAKIGGGVG